MAAQLHTTAQRRLHAVGQRYTVNREALVVVLERAGRPLSLPQILDGTDGVPQSSAYRNLAVLERAGVVRRLITDEGVARFELAEDLTEHHHHLICSECGKVEDVTIPAEVESTMARTVDRLARRSGFEKVQHRLDLIGTCRACA